MHEKNVFNSVITVPGVNEFDMLAVWLTCSE